MSQVRTCASAVRRFPAQPEGCNLGVVIMGIILDDLASYDLTLPDRVFPSLTDIMDACETAWNRFANNHGLVRSLCAVAWAPASPAL